MSNKSTDGTKNFGTFVNAAGETYQIRGLSPLLPEKIRKAVLDEFVAGGWSIPEVPTYTVKTVSGEEEIHQHDETTLVVEGDPDATKKNQADWQEYKRTTAQIDGEYSAKLMRAVFNGVQCTPSDEWRSEMRLLGIVVPADPAAEKYLYVETRVVQSPVDISRLMTSVFRLAGIINEEAVAEAEATFQRALEEATVKTNQIKK